MTEGSKKRNFLTSQFGNNFFCNKLFEGKRILKIHRRTKYIERLQLICLFYFISLREHRAQAPLYDHHRTKRVEIWWIGFMVIFTFSSSFIFSLLNVTSRLLTTRNIFFFWRCCKFLWRVFIFLLLSLCAHDK